MLPATFYLFIEFFVNVYICMYAPLNNDYIVDIMEVSNNNINLSVFISIVNNGLFSNNYCKC